MLLKLSFKENIVSFLNFKIILRIFFYEITFYINIFSFLNSFLMFINSSLLLFLLFGKKKTQLKNFSNRNY